MRSPTPTESSPALLAPAATVAATSAWWLPLAVMGLTVPLWLHWYEPTLFLTLNQWAGPVAAPFWTGLSLLGNGWGVLGVTAPLLVLAPRLMWAWLCAAPFAIVFARVGKALLESPRPAAVVDNAQMRIVGETLHNVAMPSGHTLTAFAVASAIYFALPVGARLRHSWLWVLAMGAGLSRVAVGAHWPGDVAVGASLGILAGLLGQLLLVRMGPQHLQPRHWSLRCVALLVLVALYHLLFDQLDFAENQPLQYLLAALTTASLLVFLRQNFKGEKTR